jgi:hypothetical protein
MNEITEGDVRARTYVAARDEVSAMSWGAILGGAAAAAALSLILLALGLGLGLSSVSPWSYQSASSGAITFGTIAWLLVTSLAASGLGGYLAGRLRARWHDSDLHEAHFRDTAHGFLAWCVATLVGAAVLTSAASGMVGMGGAVGATSASLAGVSGSSSASVRSTGPDSSANYFVDMMFRGSKADSSVDSAGSLREARGILVASLAGEMSAGDKTYLGQMVASRTGLTQVDAEQRVVQTTAAAKLAADATAAKAKELTEGARKIAAHTALWVFISLLVGAFYSSLAATWGGKQRDPAAYSRQTI